MSARSTDRQRGVALITMLLIVALLTAIVSRLSLSSELWLRQVENGTALAQAEQAARAAQYWIGILLEDDNNEFDGATDSWAQPLPPMPVGWGELYAWLEDMQARFNINNLVDGEGLPDPAAMEQFERLLQVLELNPALAQAVVDWIDADSDASGPAGAEDIYYLGLEVPYAAANRPLADIRELRMVRSMTTETWTRLEPYITALPRGTQININMATPQVIAAVFSGRGEPGQVMNEAKRWSEEAARLPYNSMENFAERALGDRTTEVSPVLSVDTRYVLAHTQLVYGRVEYSVATLYQRNQGRAEILSHERELF